MSEDDFSPRATQLLGKSVELSDPPRPSEAFFPEGLDVPGRVMEGRARMHQIRRHQPVFQK